MKTLAIKAHMLMSLKKAELLSSRDRGATAIEYGLIVGLLAVVIVGAIAILGPRITQLFSTAASAS